MLVGYVSDERYVAIADCLLLFESTDPPGVVFEARSAANGGVYVDAAPGDYRVALNHPDFGPKWVNMTVGKGEPHQFRLLSNALLGYAWPKAVRAGECSEFRVHSQSQYHLSLWRYGVEKQLVRPIGWFDEHGPGATKQIVPDGDYTQTGVEWNRHGYASPHHKQFVTAPERSGLYFFHAKDHDGRFFSFPWIVSPAEPTAPIAVLMSNITWNAYNNFGGRSNYIHPAQLPPQPTLNARLELSRYTDPDSINYSVTDYAPLSFERPEPWLSIAEHEQITDPIPGRAGCHLVHAEWRALGWLENEGLPHDVYAETDLQFGRLDLDRYQVLIITTHPEYWSREMFNRVKDWVFHRGGKLIYLGGNGMNCDVEFVSDDACIYRNEDDRELRKPENGFESRFHQRGESEASLLGVVYDPRGIMTAAPYRVIDSTHWAFRETGLREGDLFGIHSQHERVPGGASGHETDKISPSSPANLVHIAKGTNPDDGGADMVTFDTPSGGRVFSVGSISWPSCLWVDRHVALITRNVVTEFLNGHR